MKTITFKHWFALSRIYIEVLKVYNFYPHKKSDQVWLLYINPCLGINQINQHWLNFRKIRWSFYYFIFLFSLINQWNSFTGEFYLGGNGGRLRERSVLDVGRWRFISEREKVFGTSKNIEDRELGREQS